MIEPFDWSRVSNAAYDAYKRQSYVEAQRLITSYMADLEKLGETNSECLAYALFLLGSCYYMRDQYDQAQIYLLRAAELYEERDLERTVGCLKLLGVTYHADGQWEKAEVIYANLVRKIESGAVADQELVPESLALVGEFFWLSNRYAEAQRLFRQAFGIVSQPSASIASLSCLADKLFDIIWRQPVVPELLAVIKIFARLYRLLRRKLTQAQPPDTRRGQISNSYFGTVVKDPYRWLENITCPEVEQWASEQCVYADQWLSKLPGRTMLHRRVWQLYQTEEPYLPYEVSGARFFQHRPVDRSRSQLYQVKKLGQFPKMVFDANLLPESLTVGHIYHSPDGRYIAYSLSEDGSDSQTVRVKDLKSGKDLKDRLPSLYWLSLAWKPDSSGIYYCGVFEQGGRARVFYHQLGTRSTRDDLIYECKEDDLFLSIRAVVGGKYLLLAGSRAHKQGHSVLLKSLVNKRAKPLALVPEQQFQYRWLCEHQSRLYFITDHNARLFKFVSFAIPRDRGSKPRMRVEIPQSKELLTDVFLLTETLIVGVYLTEKGTVLRRMQRGGKIKGEIALSEHVSLVSYSGVKHQGQYLLVEGYTRPGAVLECDQKAGKLKVFSSMQSVIECSQYETKKMYARSKDGTRVPYYVSCKKGLKRNGDNPTLLTGYGGFDHRVKASFDRYRMAWMELGGIFVEAVLRGDGEYGREWRRAGMGRSKQNSFDDFMAVAASLIRNRFTRPARLGVYGASNGGLLVAAALTQRPQLFGAVVIANGLLDMLRFHEFNMARYYVREYGYAKRRLDFRTLYEYSPLHKLRPGNYPATLITVGARDDRVSPAHSYKFAAELQNNQMGLAPILLSVEDGSGHTLKSKSNMPIDTLLFLAHSLGLLPESVLQVAAAQCKLEKDGDSEDDTVYGASEIIATGAAELTQK